MTISVGHPSIDQDGDEVVWTVSVEGTDTPAADVLWYRVPSADAAMMSDRLDAALVGLLFPAMAARRPLHLDGVVTDELLHAANRELQPLLRVLLPTLTPIAVTAAEVRPAAQPAAAGVATGLSGGVDSFCVLADNTEGTPGPLRVDRLLFNNVGSHGRAGYPSGAVRGSELFDLRYQRLRPVAEQLGLPFTKVDSNLDAHYVQELPFQQTHTLRNASVPLLLQQGIGRFLYASGCEFGQIAVGPTYDTAYVDPLLLPIMSTRAVRMVPSGTEHTRVAKTLRLPEIELSKTHLDVCTSPFSGMTNCSRCRKCLRTLLTLELGGVLDQYSQAFDLQVYAEHRADHIAQVLTSKDPLHRQIVEYAAASGRPFSSTDRLRASAKMTVRRLHEAAYRARKQLRART
jgi:hypothetical protein